MKAVLRRGLLQKQRTSRSERQHHVVHGYWCDLSLCLTSMLPPCCAKDHTSLYVLDCMGSMLSKQPVLRRRTIFSCEAQISSPMSVWLRCFAFFKSCRDYTKHVRVLEPIGQVEVQTGSCYELDLACVHQLLLRHKHRITLTGLATNATTGLGLVAWPLIVAGLTSTYALSDTTSKIERMFVW